VFDLLFRVPLYAVGHFSRAVWALARYSVTGEYPPERKEK
jgi:hypothetical protein